MTAIESARPCALRVPLPLFACAAALLVAGCVSYSPSQLSAMQSVDLCQTLDMQAYNLTPETRSAIQSELGRRKESCSTYSATVAQRRQDVLDYETYGKQSP